MILDLGGPLFASFSGKTIGKSITNMDLLETIDFEKMVKTIIEPVSAGSDRLLKK